MVSNSVDLASGASETTKVRPDRRGAAAEFRKHFERIAMRRSIADDLRTTGAPSATTAPGSPGTAESVTAPAEPAPVPSPEAPAPAVATQPPAASSAPQRLSATAISFLTDSRLPMLETLPGDLTAGDPQYNVREVTLRERLNLQEVERRLRGSAEALELSFDKSDLEGVLRNAGYDATHLGSTERYMAAVEKFVGEAENNYRRRAGNGPGSQA